MKDRCWVKLMGLDFLLSFLCFLHEVSSLKHKHSAPTAPYLFNITPVINQTCEKDKK